MVCTMQNTVLTSSRALRYSADRRSFPRVCDAARFHNGRVDDVAYKRARSNVRQGWRMRGGVAVLRATGNR